MGPLSMRFGPGGPLLMGVHFSWYTGTVKVVPQKTAAAQITHRRA